MGAKAVSSQQKSGMLDPASSFVLPPFRNRVFQEMNEQHVKAKDIPAWKTCGAQSFQKVFGWRLFCWEFALFNERPFAPTGKGTPRLGSFDWVANLS